MAAVVFVAASELMKAGLRRAARADDMARFAALRRNGAIASLMFWMGMGVWLYLRPQYEDWTYWVTWVLFVGILAYYTVELRRAGSNDANRRLAARLIGA